MKNPSSKRIDIVIQTTDTVISPFHVHASIHTLEFPSLRYEDISFRSTNKESLIINPQNHTGLLLRNPTTTAAFRKLVSHVM